MYPSITNNHAGIFVHEQAKALIEQGVEVCVVSPKPWAPFPIKYLSHKWNSYSKIPKESIINRIKVYYPSYTAYPKGLFFASSGKRMYSGIKRLVEMLNSENDFDLIHAHVALPDGYAAMKISEKWSKPLIVSVHGQDLQQTIHRNRLYKKIIIKVFQCADTVILVSNKLKRIVDKNQIPCQQFAVIHNGVDLEKIITAKQDKVFKANVKEIMLSVSNIIKTKGLDYNIYALYKLKDLYPNLEYHLIGSGPEEKYLRLLANKLGLQDRVKFIGQLPHNEVFKHMHNCRFFSLPSWNEAFGVVYIEAMACGKPVIGCRGEGIEDFVADREIGMLVKPHDVDSLAEAIDYFLSNPDRANYIGEKAKKLITEDYTWQRNAEKTVKVYREVLNSFKENDLGKSY